MIKCFQCHEPIEMEWSNLFGMRVPTGVWIHSTGQARDCHRAYPDWYTPEMRGHRVVEGESLGRVQ